MHLPPKVPSSGSPLILEPAPDRIEILDAFADIPDIRKISGKRHQIVLCLALFTLAIAAGNQGFLAIGDWLKS